MLFMADIDKVLEKCPERIKSLVRLKNIEMVSLEDVSTIQINGIHFGGLFTV